MILYTCPICYRVNEGDYCPVCSARLREAMNYDPLGRPDGLYEADDGHLGTQWLMKEIDRDEAALEWADAHGPEL